MSARTQRDQRRRLLCPWATVLVSTNSGQPTNAEFSFFHQLNKSCQKTYFLSHLRIVWETYATEYVWVAASPTLTDKSGTL